MAFKILRRTFKKKTTCEDNITKDIVDSSNKDNMDCKTQDLSSTDTQRGPETSDMTGPQVVDQDSLCELLGLSRSECSRGSAQVSEDQAKTLIQESVRSHLPQQPPDLDTDLQRHLLAVQTVMQSELIRLAPRLKPHGLMGVLTQSYHHAVFRQMKELLLQTCSSRTCLQLIHWALTQYLSQELFLHPDLQTLNLLQYLDLVLLSNWTQDAQDKLFTFLQTDVSSQLNSILERERQHEPCRDAEDYVSAYVNVIQCIKSPPTKAFEFSPELSCKLTQVCLNELLAFVNSYKTQWLQWLEMLKKKKMIDQEMLQFYRMLTICNELKKYISETRLKWTEVSDVTEKIETSLEETEASTLTVLCDTVAVFTESGLKKFFKSNRNSFLMTDLERLFRPESWLSLEEHKTAMDRCYRLIVSLYSKHLTSHTLHRLEESWSPDVANSVSEDAELIHKIMTNLCPEVEECNFILHFISDLLKTTDLNAIKLSAGGMISKCKEKCVTEGASLLPALLRWKGLTKREIQEVLDSLEDLLEAKSAPRSQDPTLDKNSISSRIDKEEERVNFSCVGGFFRCVR